MKNRLDKIEKPKRKFRAMTNAEFCDKWRKNHLFCKSIVSDGYCCPISPTGNCFREDFLNKPYIINDKYILIEVFDGMCKKKKPITDNEKQMLE